MSYYYYYIYLLTQPFVDDLRGQPIYSRIERALTKFKDKSSCRLQSTLIPIRVSDSRCIASDSVYAHLCQCIAIKQFTRRSVRSFLLASGIHSINKGLQCRSIRSLSIRNGLLSCIQQRNPRLWPWMLTTRPVMVKAVYGQMFKITLRKPPASIVDRGRL